MGGSELLTCGADPDCQHLDDFRASLDDQDAQVEGLQARADATPDLDREGIGRCRVQAEVLATAVAATALVRATEWHVAAAGCDGVSCALAALAVPGYLRTIVE